LLGKHKLIAGIGVLTPGEKLVQLPSIPVPIKTSKAAPKSVFILCMDIVISKFFIFVGHISLTGNTFEEMTLAKTYT
jgi:hypothetical protein